MVRTAKLSIGVKDVRELVRRAALRAGRAGGWQIIIVEDADRLTEQACNALLKAIEEPTERTVWMLCAPTVEDVLPTIRSRCRLVTLTTPTTEDVAAFLVRTDGVPESLASYAARASQGHIGRARALARDEGTRNRRREVVAYPAKLTSLGACMTAAANLAEVTKEEADEVTGELDAREKADLDTAYGVVERGRRPREYDPALSALEKGQKTRAKRRHLDVVDRGLMDLVSVYRDAIAVGDRRARDAGQRGDPRRRRAGRPHRDPGAQPAADRGDLRRARADAGVQRPGGPRPRVDDGRPQGAANGAPRMKATRLSRAGCVRARAAWSPWPWSSRLGRCSRRSATTDDPARRRRRRRWRRPRPRAGRDRAARRPDLAAFYAQELTWEPCRGDFQCATLTVPVDYSDPGGETIELALLKDAGRRPGRAGRLAGRQPRRPRRARHVVRRARGASRSATC